MDCRYHAKKIKMDRQTIIRNYQEKPEVSVLIVGAGVNGIGVFHDLALQGVDVLMVDKKDFCSGVSSASSHMVHGGIRYLENGEFRLVREAIRERNRLLKNAPHYVKPLSTIIPIYKWLSGIFNAPLKFLGLLDQPSERGAIIIMIGLLLYDVYTKAQAVVPKHKFRSRKASLAKFPKINPRVLCTANYFDGSMHIPERICVEILLDGEASNPRAHALNYVALENAERSRVTLIDELSGDSFVVKPEIVINAGGPWIDFVNARMGLRTQFIGGTKGSHLILDNPDLREAIGENEFFFENKDGRIVLIYPLEDMVMIGTSDVPIDDPEEVRCTDEEIEYFFGMVPHVFPDIALTREQIVFQFSGVRPLPTMDAANPGQISRDHSIRVSEPGSSLDFPIYSLVGGKWTSYRAFSEKVTDKTLGALNRPRMKSTRDLAVGGGKDYPKDQNARAAWIDATVTKTGLSAERGSILFERYGTRAEPIAAYLSQGEDVPLKYLPDYSQREIEFIALNERVTHLDDFFIRRTMLAKLGRLSLANIDEAAKIIGIRLNWPAERQSEEFRRTCEVLKEYHNVVPKDE